MRESTQSRDPRVAVTAEPVDATAKAVVHWQVPPGRPFFRVRNLKSTVFIPPSRLSVRHAVQNADETGVIVGPEWNARVGAELLPSRIG